MNFKFIIIIGVSLFYSMGSTHTYAQASIKEDDQLDFAQGLLSRGMYDMAILQYQKFISEFPHSASLQEAYLSLGEGYFLSQDFDRATGVYNQFKELFPQSDHLPVSVLRLGQIDIQQKKYDEALKELSSIDAQKQLKGQMLQSFYFYTAQAYDGLADNASAIDFFQKSSQVEGATAYTALAFKEMGRIQAQNGHYSESLVAYAKSLQLADDDTLKAELIYRIAETQFLSGQYADAIKGFGQVIDQFPSSEFSHDALVNLFLTYLNLGQYDLLLNEYQKYAKDLKDDGTYFKIHFAAVLAYIEMKKYDQANALLDRVLSFPSLKSQDRAKIFIKKADILIRQGKYKDGMALLDAYSSQNSDDADTTLFLKAQGFFGLGDFDHAFSCYENISLNFPKSRYLKASILGQAHSRQKMGRYKEAENLFKKYYDAQDDPNLKSDALFDAVMMSVKTEDVNSVISNAQEYLKTFPTGEQYSKVLIILADYYGTNNQPQEAIKLLQGYLASAQSDQKPNSAYFLLGYYEELTGKSDQAVIDYGKVDGQKEEGKFYAGALKNIALIYLSQKKEDQAMAYFDRLISQAGQNGLQIKTYIWVCNEYIREQRFKDALRIATEAEKQFPAQDLLEIKYFEAEALRGLDSCEEADKDYDIIISSKEKNVYTGSAHIGYGLCLAKANKYDNAKIEFQKALDENADDYTITVHARFELANLEATQGNFDEALRYYLLIATIYDDDYYCSESLLRAAKIAERLKRNQDALKMYSEILDKYKKSTAAVYAKERVDLLK